MARKNLLVAAIASMLLMAAPALAATYYYSGYYYPCFWYSYFYKFSCWYAVVDSTPPAISSVSAVSTTPGLATVTWTTNESSTSQVDFGTSASYGSSAGAAGLVTSHSVALTGLSYNTVYHYRVVSRDSSGNTAASADAVFTSAPLPAPPQISNVNVSNIQTVSATVSWSTDVASSGSVDYGKTVSYGQTKTGAAGVSSHQVILIGLEPATEYHFVVRAKDQYGQETIGQDMTFKTARPPASASGAPAAKAAPGTQPSQTTAMDFKNVSFSDHFKAGTSRLLVPEEKIGLGFPVLMDIMVKTLTVKGGQQTTIFNPAPKDVVDTDHDGLPDSEEETLGTDPKKMDTDGDGESDGYEVYISHTNPKDPNSK